MWLDRDRLKTAFVAFHGLSLSYNKYTIETSARAVLNVITTIRLSGIQSWNHTTHKYFLWVNLTSCQLAVTTNLLAREINTA